MKQIVVYKGRTKILPVSLGVDVSNDVITSQIREEKSSDSPLIADWAVSFATDGTDGEIVLTLDDSSSVGVVKSVGYMDIKRTSGGEPLAVLDEPLEVLFKSSVTE